MEKLDQIIDRLVKEFVAQVRPVLESELTSCKKLLDNKDNQISVLQAANFELKKTIEGFEKEHKNKATVEVKEELDESIEISDDDDDKTLVTTLAVRTPKKSPKSPSCKKTENKAKSPILNTTPVHSKSPILLTQNTASKLLFGNEEESSEDEDFNAKRKKNLEKTLSATLETLSDDAKFWNNTVLNKKRKDDELKKPKTKRQKTKQTKLLSLTPKKSGPSKKKETLDLAKLQRFARGEAFTQERRDLAEEINPPKPEYDYNKRTDPGSKYWINGEMDDTQATVYSQ